MITYLLWLSIFFGAPVSAFGQFVDIGSYVEVKQGTTLCSKITVDEAKRFDPDRYRTFWRVMGPMRTNNTQSVGAYMLETMYDRESGNTTIKETHSPKGYFATFFKRDPEHEDMLLMISPPDGKTLAIVGVCSKRSIG